MRARSKWADRTLLVLLLAIVVGPTTAIGAAEQIAQPEWTVGDWWEAGQYRVTVVSRDKDIYELIRTPKGTEPDTSAARTYKVRMTIDGQVIVRRLEDGSTTETSAASRYEWVHFPLVVGRGWTFEVLTRGRGAGESNRYEHQCVPTKWEEIVAAGKDVRALRIECQSWVRGWTTRWEHTVWYAPDAKRYIRLTSHYSGGPTFDCTAWSVRP